MTRNFKKRLLALVLTLALCTALMLPGFAATAAHTHSGGVRQGSSTIYYNEHSYAYHTVVTTTTYKCTCGEFYSVTESHPESHSVPCSLCGFRG